MADLSFGQRMNYVPETETMHNRPEVGDADAIIVTVPDGRGVEAGDFVLAEGFFGVALNTVLADEDADEYENDLNPDRKLVVQLKYAEYETDQIDTSADFKPGTPIFFDPGAKEIVEDEETGTETAAHSGTASTMIDNLESALEDLVGDGNVTVTEDSSDVYDIEFDISVGDPRLVPDLSTLTGSGDVTIEQTQAYSGEDADEEIWQLDIGNASGGDVSFKLDNLFAGRVTAEKDTNDVIWFIKPTVMEEELLETNFTESL